MFIKVNVQQSGTNVIREMRFNSRHITTYWQAGEAGVVMVNHNKTTYRVVIDIETLDAMLIG